MRLSRPRRRVVRVGPCRLVVCFTISVCSRGRLGRREVVGVDDEIPVAAHHHVKVSAGVAQLPTLRPSLFALLESSERGRQPHPERRGSAEVSTPSGHDRVLDRHCIEDDVVAGRQQCVDCGTHPGQQPFADLAVVDPSPGRAVRVAALLDPESRTGSAGVVAPLVREHREEVVKADMQVRLAKRQLQMLRD